jgi:hypothetical protein
MPAGARDPGRDPRVLPFTVNAGTLAVAVALIAGVPALIRTTNPPTATGPGRQVRAGSRWLRQHGHFSPAPATSTALAMTDSAWFSLLVLYVHDILRLNPAWYGRAKVIRCAWMATIWGMHSCMTMTREPMSSFSSPEPAGSSGPPAPVRQGTTVLFVLNGLALAWALFLLLGIVLLVVDNESTPGWIALPLVMVAIQTLFLYLTWKIRRGSRAAWVTMLVMLGVHVVAWLGMAVGNVDASNIVSALIMLLPAVAAVAYLVVPRSSRRYFLGR